MVAALPLDGEPVGVHLVFADDEPLICVTDRMRIHCYGLGEYSHSIDLPPLHVDEKEQAVWEQLEAGGLDLVSANQRLKQLALKGDGGSPPIRLTPLSMRLNSISETDAKFQLNDLLNQAVRFDLY
jgi:hypothetical protein